MLYLIIFTKLLETSFSSKIIASFTEFECQGTDTFGFIQVQTFKIHVQGNFLHKSCMDTSLKSRQVLIFGDYWNK